MWTLSAAAFKSETIVNPRTETTGWISSNCGYSEGEECLKDWKPKSHYTVVKLVNTLPSDDPHK